MRNNKYNITSKDERVYKGIQFDSKAEIKRYTELEAMQAESKITNLTYHAKYEIYPSQTIWNTGEKIRPVTYEVDFLYWQDNILTWEEVKGYKTNEYRLKKKLIVNYCNAHEIVFREVKP